MAWDSCLHPYNQRYRLIFLFSFTTLRMVVEFVFRIKIATLNIHRKHLR